MARNEEAARIVTRALVNVQSAIGCLLASREVLEGLSARLYSDNQFEVKPNPEPVNPPEPPPATDPAPVEVEFAGEPAADSPPAAPES